MKELKILYVEDDPVLARGTTALLKRNHYEVITVNNGQEALQLVKKIPFDICIIDVMLPGIDGYAVVKKIRELNPLVPIIFVTARTLADDAVKGFETGANDYMRKPFSIEELMARINELVKRTEKRYDNKHTYEIGSYTFNYHKMEISRGSEKITLTYRENEIIKQLIHNKNEIVYTQQILLELWGDDSFYNSRSLNVFMTKIRRYFNQDNNIAIVNIRGIGYKIIV